LEQGYNPEEKFDVQQLNAFPQAYDIVIVAFPPTRAKLDQTNGTVSALKKHHCFLSIASCIALASCIY